MLPPTLSMEEFGVDMQETDKYKRSKDLSFQK